MLRWKRDVIYGVVILAACVFGIVETQGLSLKGYEYWTTRPDVYVWMWLTLLAVISLIMILRAVIKRNAPYYQEELPKIWCKEGVVTLALLVLYLLVMKTIGFIASTLIFEFVTMAIYGGKMGKVNFKADKKKAVIRLVIYAVISIIATFATYYLFTNVLAVRLPKSKLF